MGYCPHPRLFALLVLVLVAVVVSASARDLPIISFDEGYNKLFGDDNLMILKDGKSVHLSLNERTGILFGYYCCCWFLRWMGFLTNFFLVSVSV